MEQQPRIVRLAMWTVKGCARHSSLPACVDVDDGVFLERVLAGRCKSFHHMVPLILVACSCGGGRAHVGCRRSLSLRNQREDERESWRRRKQEHRAKDALSLVSVGRRQDGG